MKFDLDHHARAYTANLHRRRAAECRALAEKRSKSALRQELEEEARLNDALAERYDAGPEERAETRAAAGKADLTFIDNSDVPTGTEG